MADRSPHPPRVAASFKYGAEAFALAGIAYGLIKAVGRAIRSQISPISDDSLEAAHLAAIAPHTPAASADALVRQGIVSAADLSAMTPREREFLVAAAGKKIDATPSVRAGARTSPTPPRLHLITPSRPPLGMSVHCPGCGAPLDREALQRLGSTSCARCKRPVSAHIQRGRLTVIVEETPEEGEHRRRVEGS